MTAAFASGIGLGLVCPVPAVIVLTVVLAPVALALTISRHFVLATAVGALLVGAFLGLSARGTPSLADPLEALVSSEAQAEVEARWLRTLRYDPSPEVPGRALLEIFLVNGQPARAVVALSVGQGPLWPRPGDAVGFRSRLSRPRGLANPGRPDVALAMRAQGIDLSAFVRTAGEVKLLSRGWRWWPRRLAAEAHLSLAAAIDQRVAAGRARFLRAVVLGERDAGGPEVEAGFKAAGAVHALSVSGLHLTAVAALSFLLLRRGLLLFPAVALRVRTEAVAGLLAALLVAFYTLITGEAVATRRAALMAGLALGAVLLRRFPSLPNAIAAAALILLAAEPLLLVDVSFQLSFTSVIALALLVGAFGNDPPPKRWPARLGRAAWRGFVVSLAAFFASAPLCAHHFAELSPAAPVGNLLIVPLVELGVVPIGLGGSVLSALWAPLGMVPLTVASWLSAAVLWLAELFRQGAPVWAVWSPSPLEAGLLTLAVLLVLGTRAGQRRAPRLWLAGVLLLTGAGSLGARALARRVDGDMRVTFLDVGQGDAALVEGPAGLVILVDGGGVSPGPGGGGRFDPGARVIEPVLRRKTIDRIDLVVLSHPHPDHMNGLFRVLERFSVKTLWVSGDDGGNPQFARLLDLARQRGIAVVRGQGVALEGLKLDVRGPWVGEVIGPPPGVSVNDASLVLRLSHPGGSVLFAGDIEEQGEAELVANIPLHGDIRSDVLKVPHHASRTSSSSALLDAVSAPLAVASLAARNRYGFPHQEVVERYRRHGVRLLRTDQVGAVTVRFRAGAAPHVTCVRDCR